MPKMRKMAPKCNNNTKQLGILTNNRNFGPKIFFPREKSHIWLHLEVKNAAEKFVTINTSTKITKKAKLFKIW